MKKRNRATPMEESKSPSKPRVYNQSVKTFGLYKTKDGNLAMGDKEVEVDGDKTYHFTPGLIVLITH